MFLYARYASVTLISWDLIISLGWQVEEASAVLQHLLSDFVLIDLITFRRKAKKKKERSLVLVHWRVVGYDDDDDADDDDDKKLEVTSFNPYLAVSAAFFGSLHVFFYKKPAYKKPGWIFLKKLKKN